MPTEEDILDVSDEELLDFVEEGNEQTWLKCDDGELGLLYDLAEFLNISKCLPTRVATEHGEGWAKTIMRQRPKQRHWVKSDDPPHSKDKANRVRNLMLKENRGVLSPNGDTPIFINTSQVEPTLYFQDYQSRTTPLSTSGSNIKRPSSMYDSLLDKCDRSLLDDFEIPNKSITSFIGSSPANSMIKSVESDDSLSICKELPSDGKINTKTFTRPKRTPLKNKAKDPAGRRSLIDELTLRYSSDYINAGIASDLDSPLDGIGKDLNSTFEISTTKIEEHNQTFASSESVGLNSTFVQSDNSNKEENDSDAINSTFVYDRLTSDYVLPVITENSGNTFNGKTSYYYLPEVKENSRDINDETIEVEENSLYQTLTNSSTGDILTDKTDEDAYQTICEEKEFLCELNSTVKYRPPFESPSPEFKPHLMSTPDKKMGSRLKVPTKKTIPVPSKIEVDPSNAMRKVVSEENLAKPMKILKKPHYFASTSNLNNNIHNHNNKNFVTSAESLSQGCSSTGSLNIPRPSEGSKLPLPKQRVSRIPVTRIPVPSQRTSKHLPK